MSDDKDVSSRGPEEKTVAMGGGAARAGNPDRTIQGMIIPGSPRRRTDSVQPAQEPPRRARPDSMVPPSGVIATGSVPRGRADSGVLLTGSGGSEITGIPWVPGQMPAPGVRIAHYELIRELGTGGMGTVFLARDLKLGRKVAIKILQAQHSELAQRFLVEARATARCHHENIVVIYEVGQIDDQPFMVLEYLKGKTLTDLIAGGRRLPPARALEMIVPVVRALSAAHEQGIVHRDLKPDNIMLTEAGTIKVLDFGIAKIHEAGGDQSSGAIVVPADQRVFTGDTALTRPGMIMGTVKYMAPEQWGIGIDIDHRTDIWACGIILFRLLAGRHPLSPLQGNQLVCTAMLDQPMPRLRVMAPDVPAGLADVVDRCLIKIKDHRWSNARELLRALEPFMPGRYATRELELDESPYAGLGSFQENDAGRFFGRGREIQAGVQRVRERAIVAITGPSGVGKSSFVRAGLVPALKAAGEKWETMVIRPGRNPMAALAALTAPMVGDSGGGRLKQDGSSTTLVDDIKEQQDEIGRLIREPGHLGMVLRSRAKRERCKMLLFVDQFEELYTQVADPKERLAFTTALASAADDAAAPVRVVVSLRSDFLDRVSEDPAFVSEVTQGMFFMTTPTRDGLREALVLPAEMAGYRFETPMMVDDMLAHLETTPGALPLLQFAASKLWEQRDNVHKLLTLAAYQGMGGIVGALATHADATLAEMSGPMQGLVRALLLRLITPERTRAIVSLAELGELSSGGEIQRLVDNLVSARLLVVSSTGEGGIGSTTIEIVHESLIHSWPALRRWLEETSEDSAFIDSVRVAAKQWNTRGRAPGLLWRGSEADDVRHWAKRGRMAMLNDVQRAFIHAVMAEATRAERRRSMATIGIVIALSLLLVASVGVMLKIRSSEQHATRAARAAELALAEEQKAKVAKEQEMKQRILAEVDRAKAREGEQVATGERDDALNDLAVKNEELRLALIEAMGAKELAEAEENKAKREENRAEAKEKEAIEALAEARFQAKRAENLLQEKLDRIQRLEDQLGSPMVDTLK